MKRTIQTVVLSHAFLLISHLCLAQSFQGLELLMPVRTFYYPSNGWQLSSENLAYINSSLVIDLKSLPDTSYTISLEGHTDDVGNANSNIELARKRVTCVYDALVKNGISPNNIKLTYFGEENPEKRKVAVSQKKADIRYANRRVLVIVHTKTD